MQIKKILIALFVFVLAAVVAVYVFIPARLKVAETSIMKVNTQGAFRILMDESDWHNWWPGPKVFNYNDQRYHLNKKMFNAFELGIFIKNDSLASRVQLVPFDKDSTGFTWSCELDGSNNPVKRFRQYRKARTIKENMSDLLGHLKTFIEKEENVYGFIVKKVKVADSVLISTRNSFDHYPDAAAIDKMIQKLRNYIIIQKAKEKNFPMLNILQVGTDKYEAMVAIAVERELPATKEFAPKQVFKGGNLLEAAVRGGPLAIRNAVLNFENYKQEYKYTSPAIPYQLIVTDRMKEADTSKWITRLYYPVF